MKNIGVSTTALFLALGALVLCVVAEPFYAGLLAVPFALGPLVYSLQIALRWKEARKVQRVIALSTSLYAAWFLFIYLDGFYWNPDAQSGILFFVIGIWSLPVMIPFWIAAHRIGKKSTSKEIKA
ncbi:MAG: hypothetical protein QM715_03860 [Nibricoccus sp.]